MRNTTTTTPLHATVLAVCSKPANVRTARTMPMWGVLVGQHMGANPAHNHKATGRALRGLVGRSTGNGVGRGNAYPPVTGAQLAAMAGHSSKAIAAATAGNSKGAATHNARATALWGKARSAQGKQAKQGKRAARVATAQASSSTPAQRKAARAAQAAAHAAAVQAAAQPAPAPAAPAQQA